MAAALLAMEHFNERNPTIVPDLANYTDCPFKFDMNRSLFFDSGMVGHMAAESFLTQVLRSGTPPCAIAGPYDDDPAVDLSVLATAAKIPLVAHRAYEPRVVDEDAGNYSSQVYPIAASQAQRVIEALARIGRTDFISVLYPSTELGLAVRESMVISFEDNNVTQWFTANYVHPGRNAEASDWESLYQAIAEVKQQGYRTIIVALEYSDKEIPEIAVAADEYGMNDGDFVWVWVGSFDTQFDMADSKIAKLLYGTAQIAPTEPMWYFDDSFWMTMLNVTSEFEDLVNRVNPIKPGEPGYAFAYPGYFSDVQHFDNGQEFMFDAIISIGLGACLAQRDENGTVLGEDHVAGIREAVFQGTTGLVRFENSGQTPGARVAEDVIFSTVNFLTTPEAPNQLNVTEIYAPDNSLLNEALVNITGSPGFNHTWFMFTPYIYGDGTQVPPPLRNSPNMNFLNNGLRILGFILLGTVFVSSLASILWVFINRSHKVLRAAQPYFLYLLSFGSAVFASGIITLSFDESYGWNTAELSAACMATPWLLATGYIITYCALFSKLYRVNEVLQFTRRKVTFYQVIGPAVGFISAALVVLAIWTATSPLRWQRIEINAVTGESIGRCISNHLGMFIGVLAIVSIVPMGLTCWIAWKTRDVDDAYSESMWIFVLVVLQLELCLLGAPVIAILRNLSTDGRYIGFVIILWAFPMSTLVLIMLPKVQAFCRCRRGATGEVKKRGQHRAVHVSGYLSEAHSSSSKVLHRNVGPHPETHDSFTITQMVADRQLSQIELPSNEISAEVQAHSELIDKLREYAFGSSHELAGTAVSSRPEQSMLNCTNNADVQAHSTPANDTSDQRDFNGERVSF